MANEQLSVLEALKIAQENLGLISISGYSNVQRMARALDMLTQSIGVLEVAHNRYTELAAKAQETASTEEAEPQQSTQ